MPSLPIDQISYLNGITKQLPRAEVLFVKLDEELTGSDFDVFNAGGDGIIGEVSADEFEDVLAFYSAEPVIGEAHSPDGKVINDESGLLVFVDFSEDSGTPFKGLPGSYGEVFGDDSADFEVDGVSRELKFDGFAVFGVVVKEAVEFAFREDECFTAFFIDGAGFCRACVLVREVGICGVSRVIPMDEADFMVESSLFLLAELGSFDWAGVPPKDKGEGGNTKKGDNAECNKGLFPRTAFLFALLVLIGNGSSFVHSWFLVSY